MEQRQILKEVCVNNVQEAIEAEKNGANRIELCIRLDLGGLTPHNEDIVEAQNKLNIPISVMIRPREGNFVYNEMELQQMIESIEFCKKNKVYGVVFGNLNQDQTLNVEQTKKLIEVSQGMSITFHRAFDEVKNPLEVLETLISMGVHRILTSGQQPKAIEGIQLLQQCIKQSQGRIIIMPGSGINKQNLKLLQDQLNTNEFHGSKIV